MRYIRPYTTKTEWIPIGKTRWGKVIHNVHRKFGVTGVFAKARTGKTSIVKKILCYMAAKGRRLIIFDPEEDYHHLDRLNFNCKSPMAVQDLKVVKDYAFTIDQFYAQDFATMGFPRKAMHVASSLARLVDEHKNKPELFKSLLEEIPTTKEAQHQLLESYGIEAAIFEPNTINAAISWLFLVQPSLKIKLEHKTPVTEINYMYDIFYDPDGAGQRDEFNSDVVQELALKNNLVFDMRSLSGGMYNTYVGLIIRSCYPILKRLKPIFVLEEADKLCSAEDFYSSSYEEIAEISLKRQRDDVHLIAISQSEKIVNRVITDNCHQKIIGKLAYDDERSDKLYWNPDRGIRNFCLVDDNNKDWFFESDVCPCM